MRIYVAHSTNFDFKNELYEPLRALSSDEYMFIFPHEDDIFKHSKQIIAESDLVLAEVSYPSTGQGIELGWASAESVPIICVHKSNSKISGSLQAVSYNFLEYSTADDMIAQVKSTLETIGH